MDGIPALDLWGSVSEVFHSSPNQTDKTKDVREARGNLSANPQPDMRKQIPTTNTNLDLTNIDHVPSSGTRSGSNTMLYVFEDNEAVIKMIIKGRIPTMRHVSRTHRVALDWLFDRISLDSKIQLWYIDTKHQLTDILTKGNFTREEWNTGWPASPEPLFPCVRGIRISFFLKKFSNKMPWGVKTNHKSAHFSKSHTDAHDRLDDVSIHRKPHFPHIKSVFKISHNMVRSREERFAMERMATRGCQEDRGEAEFQQWDMCQEPTELLWIGCLTGLILILKFRFDTLIPNINSHTFWPQVISLVTNGIIFFICSTSAISALLAALRIPAWWAAAKRWRKGCRSKKEKQEVSVAKSKSTAMNPSSDKFLNCEKANCIPKVREILIATGKPESRMRRNSKSDAASSSQARLQDAYLRGLMDTAMGKPVASKEKSVHVDFAESETGSLREEEVTERPVACETAKGKSNASSKSDCKAGPKAERIEWSHNLHMSPATIHHTEAVFSIVRRNLLTRKWRPYGWFGREHGYLGQISECHSSSDISSWTGLWGDFTRREE